MRQRRKTLAALMLLSVVTAHAVVLRASADYVAVEHKRQTIYHSPQKPGFTSWVGAWLMPDGGLMTCFTQPTGPVEGRPRAPKEVREKLNWPPGLGPMHENYDMTGLDMRNIHLRSADAAKTWKQVSADLFKTCMNGVSGEAETALADGTVLRGVFGFYLPYNPEVPKTGYLQRSHDGTRTWGKPELMLDPKKYSTWPRRIRVLRDGRLIVLLGVARAPAGSYTRREFSKLVSRCWSSLLTRAKPGRARLPPFRTNSRAVGRRNSTRQSWPTAICCASTGERTMPSAGREY